MRVYSMCISKCVYCIHAIAVISRIVYVKLCGYGSDYNVNAGGYVEVVDHGEYGKVTDYIMSCCRCYI